MKKFIALILAVMMVMSVMAGCTESAANTPDTNVSETDVVETAEPKYGQLQVKDGKLCGEDGNPVQLRGLSTSNLVYSQFRLNDGCIGTLADDWGIDIFRLAMYTYEGHTGYPTHKEEVMGILEPAIKVCQDNNLYYIVDWHILYDGDPLMYKDEAVEFFSYISETYGDDPRLIYEICNEPNTEKTGYEVTWEDNIRPYAVEVIEAIRENDPDNIIIIGSSTYSQDLDITAKNPIVGDNLMYTMHFYSGSHGDELRAKTKVALDAGMAVFVTEWGMTDSSGAGKVFREETEEWIEFMDENSLSWCMWQYGSNVNEGTNVLASYANMEGDWPEEEYRESGLYFREIIDRYQ
ncbi:MAG: glycoside hydrolase family 5 protein [Clostridia bacterium]|nr:glycoside hydrolase family 5 protein [Clostridia bacterium]